MERTLVIIKPDGVERNLIGEVIKRYESRGLKVIGLKFLKADDELVKKHYKDDEEYIMSLGKKSEKAGDKVDERFSHSFPVKSLFLWRMLSQDTHQPHNNLESQAHTRRVSPFLCQGVPFLQVRIPQL